MAVPEAHSGSAYIFHYDGTSWTQQAKITASDGAAYDYFGDSVAISGDDAIVGAYLDDDNGDYSGSAYIFHYDGTSWSQQAKINASDAAAYDIFGLSVAISGDGAIVGASSDDDNGDDSGSAYIFHYDGTSWSQQAKITASDGAASDYFGGSVAISGDAAIVGASSDDDNGFNSGSAYIFHYDGTSWSQQAKITASDGAASDYFGGSVAISGDAAIVGASSDDDNGFNSGSAYIFHYDGTSWSQQAKITASDGAASDYFGRSVAISGDGAIVGAYGDDDNGFKSGSAYIFHYDGTSWSQQAKINASDAAASDYFGWSVAISGDGAIVDAHGDDDNGASSGSAYIFQYDGTSWSQQAKITASDGAAGDIFGRSVAISGDGAIVGAPYDDDNGASSGSAYIYDISGGGPDPIPEFSTIAIPIVSILGLLFLFSYRKRRRAQ